ncbi:putative HDEL sequence binding protein [Catenaria anguillulae PL171]|uniref:ER lumen protein-retaining receptor n=1 Tax=Catenaria anguillulae PL171 TaxID=765915 RepID=A0A1Y2HY86_9FUNG|nr:putative HDEL sequence binding protein [Catenaria anguillulae PL171]
MNIFRLVADLMHLASFFILLLKMNKTRSAAGISFKSQLLYLIVFVMRYLDLFTHFVSLYNTVMKITFIGATAYILKVMKTTYRATWDPELDSFPFHYLLAGAGAVTLFIHSKFTFMELTWSYSIWLEAVAIMPQLHQLTKTGSAETITTHYLFALGAYRGLYIVNWIYRYATEGFWEWIPFIAGSIQTVLYADFFYIYVTKVLRGKKFELPL